MRFNLDNYETVEQRLAKFWEEFPNGQIFTSIHHYDENRVVFKAEVYRDITDPRPVATGHAEEVRDASPVNRTSHVENSETSAIGRALANWKFQSKTAPRPSREEMEKVARAEQQKQPEKLTADFVTKFRKACADKGIDPQQVAKQAGVDLNELKDSDAPKLRDAWKSLTPATPAGKPTATTPLEKSDAAKTQVSEFLEQVYEAFPKATTDTPQIKNPDDPASKAQLGMIRAALSSKGLASYTDKLEKCQEILHKPDLKKIEHITKGDANKIITAIEAMK
jgi:hypothetical protein